MTDTIHDNPTGAQTFSPPPTFIDYGIPREVERDVMSLAAIFDITEFGEYRLVGDAWTDTDGVVAPFGLVARKAIEIDERLAEHRPLLDKPIRKRKARQINQTFVSVAATLWLMGYSPVPLRAGDKSVRICEWTDRFCEHRPSLVEVETEWSVGYRGFRLEGVGIATHARVALLDCEEASALADTLRIVPRLASAPTVLSPKNAGGGKIIVRLPEGIDPADWNVTLAQTGGRFEILAHGRQGAIPPTPYEDSGKFYTWADEGRTLLNTPRYNLIELTVDELRLLVDHFVVEKTETPETSKATERKATKDKSRAERAERKIAQRIQWNGNPLDFARDMSAVRTLDFKRWKPWNHSALAVAAKYGDHQPAWEAWEAWALQWKPTEPVETTNAEMKKQALANATAGQFVTMAWVVKQAKVSGWDASLARWPGIAISKGPKSDADAASIKGSQSYVARESHLYAILTDKSMQPIHTRVGQALHLFWSDGDAWPSPERLAAIVGATRDKVVRAISYMQDRGYLTTTGYGIGGSRLRHGERRKIEFTAPADQSWEGMIADRDYGRGCPLKELQGARCPDGKTQRDWIARRRGDATGSRASAHVSNGTYSTVLGMGACSTAGAVGATAEGQHSEAEVHSNARQDTRSASGPADMTEAEWASLMSSLENTAIVTIEDLAGNERPVVVTDTEEMQVARFEADSIDLADRTNVQMLASSAVPLAVNALAAICDPTVNAYERLAADMLALYNMSVPEMDAHDTLAKAVNAITYDHETGQSHPLTAVPLRKPKGSGRTIATPTETMGRLRERFVVELHDEGVTLSDTQSVLADRERRAAYAKAK